MCHNYNKILISDTIEKKIDVTYLTTVYGIYRSMHSGQGGLKWKFYHVKGAWQENFIL